VTPVPPGSTLDEQVRAAGRKLGDRNEAARLAALALEQPLAWIFAHGDEPLDPRQTHRFAEMVDRRAQGVPFAYIAGTREFFGREFSVSPAVLIPRPETEHLVAWSLDLPLPDDARVLDVGTGSGCIILSLAAERPGWQCVATDISKEALAVAAINRGRLRLPRVGFLLGNLLQPVDETGFDLVVSNPPYVAAGDPHLIRPTWPRATPISKTATYASNPKSPSPPGRTDWVTSRSWWNRRAASWSTEAGC